MTSEEKFLRDILMPSNLSAHHRKCGHKIIEEIDENFQFILAIKKSSFSLNEDGSIKSKLRVLMNQFILKKNNILIKLKQPPADI